MSVKLMNNKCHIYKKDLILRQPRFVFFVGIFNSLIFGLAVIMMALFPNETITWWVNLFVYFMLLLGLWYFWMAIMWKVTIKQDGIKFRNYLFQTKMISFEEIKSQV